MAAADKHGAQTNKAPMRAERHLKGLVLAGGKGSRLRPLTATGAKQLVPLANKPVLFYAVEQMVEAGITDIGIITGNTAAQVEAALGDGSAFGARFTFIRQPAPLGLAHAVATAAAFLGNARFCMYLGDNFLKRGIVAHVERYLRGNADAQILLTPVADPSALGVAVVDESGQVRKLVEKPREPISHLAVIGVYFFPPGIHDIIATLVPSDRGELEITDAIQGLIDGGFAVEAVVIDDDWIDTGKKDDVLEANRVVLGTVQRRIDGEVDAGSHVIGEVVIEAGARVTNSTVTGPAVIGAGVVIEHATVGPFTAIGECCEIRNCAIDHSIVMAGSVVRDIASRVTASLIGKDVVVEAADRPDGAITLMLGDHAQVGLS